MSVDLPEPDGPMTATSSPAGHLERHAAEGVDGRLALAVAATQVVGGHHRIGARLRGRVPGTHPSVTTGGISPVRRAVGDFYVGILGHLATMRPTCPHADG